MQVRTAVTLATAAGVAVTGAFLVHRAVKPVTPEPGALIERVKEVARLQTLEVRLSTTVAYEPDPKLAPTLPGQVLSWIVHNVQAKEGRAIVSGVARLSLDLSKLDEGAFRIDDDRLALVLPAVKTQVELDLERTQVVQSNLDSADTAQLFEKGRRSLAMQVERDKALQQRARDSAERALRALLTGVGFREVVFVDSVATENAGGA